MIRSPARYRWTTAPADHDIEERGVPAPSLPLLRQNMQEGDGVTPPKRKDQGHGGLRGSESRLPPRGSQVPPQIFTEPRNEDVSSDRRNVPWSPENILIDTVARLQPDLADIRVSTYEVVGGSPGCVDPSAGCVYDHQSATIWGKDQLGTVSAGF